MSSITTITKVIHTFAELLQIDIAFFNVDGILIAATEEYQRKKGNRVYLPFFQKLYEHPVTFVHKPGHMNMCQGCHFSENCPSTAEIVQNIVQNGDHYGYLSFVSFSADGQEKLLEHQKEYSYRMAQLADLLIQILYEAGLKPKLKSAKQTDYILGNSETLKEIKDLIKNITNSSSSIVITGETGTGKSLLARMIHEQSIFRKGEFVEINCASIPESLFESELFGYEEGAFTGARKRGKPGYFEMADRGTLFLDEIGDLPIHLQPKLLKVLQDGMVQRVGSTLSRKVNVRIIAATNQSLKELMEAKQFRSDLFYRLNVIPLHLPPLRERKEDIEELLPLFIEKQQERTGKFIQQYSDGFLETLKQYHWPGNIRELENVIEYSMNMEKGTQLKESALPPFLFEKSVKKQNVLEDSEKEIILQLLQQYGHDKEGKNKIADELGISVRTLYRKMDRFGISVPSRSR